MSDLEWWNKCLFRGMLIMATLALLGLIFKNVALGILGITLFLIILVIRVLPTIIADSERARKFYDERMK